MSYSPLGTRSRDGAHETRRIVRLAREAREVREVHVPFPRHAEHAACEACNHENGHEPSAIHGHFEDFHHAYS